MKNKKLLQEKELLLYIILNKNINNNDINLLNSKRLKNLLININKKEESNILNKNNTLNIQKINKLNDWRSLLYKFNKNELINTMINDKLLNNLITKIMKIKSLNNIKRMNTNILIRYIFIDNISVKHYLKKIIINIYYHIRTTKNISNIKYYNSIMNKLLNFLTNTSLNNSLINILKIIYNKDIKLNFIYFKYYYLNSNIFIKKIKQEMKLSLNTLRGRYIKNLGDKIKILNTKILINNYKNSFENYKNNINNIYINNNNKNNINIFDYYNNNKNLLLYSLLNYKYIGGLNILLKGKLQKTGRTKTQLYNKGIINNNLFINTLNYKVKETFNYTKVLNYHKNYISTSKINYNSKFGTRNLKTSFNYI